MNVQRGNSEQLAWPSESTIDEDGGSFHHSSILAF